MDSPGVGRQWGLNAGRIAASDHTLTLDNLKQLSLYTDCLGTRHWTELGWVVDRALAKALITISDALARSKPATPEEIKI